MIQMSGDKDHTEVHNTPMHNAHTTFYINVTNVAPGFSIARFVNYAHATVQITDNTAHVVVYDELGGEFATFDVPVSSGTAEVLEAAIASGDVMDEQDATGVVYAISAAASAR